MLLLGWISQEIFSTYPVFEVALDRGMSSGTDFQETPCTLLSAIFSSDVAKELTESISKSKPRSAFISSLLVLLRIYL